MQNSTLKRFTLIFVLMAGLLSCLPESATSQQNGVRMRLFGYVLDQKGHALEYANVYLTNHQTGTSTTSTGYFELNVTSADSVNVIFSLIGYEKTARTIPPTRGDLFLQIKMKESATELKDVTVSSSRRQMSTLQSLDVSKIRLIPDATGGSVESLLVTLPGVSSNNELSSQYSVRGGNFDENSVYINGIEVYRPLLIRAGQQEGLSIINPDMVGNVSFSAGGFDAKYGDKMSSVLDITYKQPKQFEASASLSLLGASAYLGTKTGNFTQMHGIRYKRNTTLLSGLDTKGEYDPSFIDYQTYMSYRFSPRWELSLLGNLSQNRYNFSPRDRETSFGTYTMAKKFTVYFEGQERDLFQTGFGSLSLNHELNKDHLFSVQTSLFSTREQESYDILGQYWLNDTPIGENPDSTPDPAPTGIGSFMEHARNRLHATVANIGLSGKHQWGAHKLEWGTTLQHEQIKDKISEWEIRDSAGYSLPYDPNAVRVIYSLKSNQSIRSIRWSAYAQENYRAVTKQGIWHFNAGVRTSYWSYNREFLVSPRGSIAFIPALNQNLTFRLSGGLYYQSPFYKEFRDTTYADGAYRVRLNEQIKSQRSLQVVAGSDYAFRAFDRPFKLTSEVYYKKLSNLIPYNVDNVRVRYYGRNLSSGYAAGADFKLFGEFVPGTDSWISFSLMKTEEKLNGKWVPRPTDQLYNISLYFQDYVPGYDKIRVHLKAIWADGLPVTAPRRGMDEMHFRTTPYRRVDIGATYELRRGESRLTRSAFFRPFKTIWIGIDAFNLLDLKNTNSYYWVTDVSNIQYAVPNYLTGRQLNFKISAEF